jgi:hypothetical protein
VLHSDDGFPQLVFRFVAAFGPSVRIGPSIILGSALTYQSLFFFRACVCTRPPFLTGSPIRTRPLLIIAHGDISTGCRESCWIGRDYRGLCASDSWPRRSETFYKGQFVPKFDRELFAGGPSWSASIKLAISASLRAAFTGSA